MIDIRELKNALNYYENIKLNELVFSYQGYKSEEISHLYECLFKSLCNYDKEITFDNQTRYNENELVSLSMELYKELFGVDLGMKLPHVKITINDLGNPYNGMSINSKTDSRIVLETMDSLYSIPTLEHEFTHCLTYYSKIINNSALEDVMPILIELITSSFISENLDCKDSLINNIKARILQLKDVSSKMAAYVMRDNLSYEEKYIYEYYKDLYAYYLYNLTIAYDLFQSYRECPEVLRKDIKRVLEGRNKVEQIVKSYKAEFASSSLENVIKLIK